MGRTRKPRPLSPSRAIGVVRVSTSKQDLGARAQRDELERWCRDHGVELVEVFEDIGVSREAPLSKRPALLLAIAALRERDAGVLLAVKRDRFGVRYTAGDVERQAVSIGARLVTTDGVCVGDGSETEEVQTQVQDIVTGLELRKIKARNKARARRCIAEGRIHGGEVPYGMRRADTGVIGRGGQVVSLEPDPVEQSVIVTIRELRATGMSYRAVAAELDTRGIPSRSGNGWQAMTVKRIADRATE